MQEANACPAAPNFRRAVFYFAGFDTFGAKYYYTLFRAGLAREFGREGRPYRISPADSVPNLGARWRVEAEDAGRKVEVDYFVLTPHEIARRYHAVGLAGIAAAWAFTVFAYARHGLLLRAFRRSWKAVILAIVLAAPPVFFVAGMAGALALLGLAGRPSAPAADWALALAVGAVGGLAGLRAGFVLAGRTFAKLILMAMYVGALHALGRIRDIDVLTTGWAGFVGTEVAAGNWDEVLLVGHSFGVVPAVDVAASLLRRPRHAGKTRVGLLTLGSTQPMVSAFRSAEAHRAALAEVATSPDIHWVDYESPSDYIAVGSVDPIASIGIDLGDRARRGPLLRSVELRRALTPHSYRRILLNLFARHFQYLKAADRPAAYSYFRIVCAAAPLT